VLLGERWGTQLARAAAYQRLLNRILREGPRAVEQTADRLGYPPRDLFELDEWLHTGRWPGVPFGRPGRFPRGDPTTVLQAPAHRVEHGTQGVAKTTWLLSSLTVDGAGLGRLKPDVLAYDGPTAAVVADAKYKRLEDRWPDRPQGIDRADLYPLTSYLARYSPDGEALGILVYPRDDAQQRVATAEASGPWALQAGGQVRFLRLGVRLQEAVEELRDVFLDVGVVPPTSEPRWSTWAIP